MKKPTSKKATTPKKTKSEQHENKSVSFGEVMARLVRVKPMPKAK